MSAWCKTLSEAVPVIDHMEIAQRDARAARCLVEAKARVDGAPPGRSPDLKLTFIQVLSEQAHTPEGWF